MVTISNQSLSVTLDPRTPDSRYANWSDTARSFKADVEVSCEVDTSSVRLAEYTTLSLRVGLFGIAENRENFLAWIPWAEIGNYGDPEIRTWTTLPVEQQQPVGFRRVAQISQAVLDVEPGQLIYPPFGYRLREDDEIMARFIVYRFTRIPDSRWPAWSTSTTAEATVTVTI